MSLQELNYLTETVSRRFYSVAWKTLFYSYKLTVFIQVSILAPGQPPMRSFCRLLQAILFAAHIGCGARRDRKKPARLKHSPAHLQQGILHNRRFLILGQVKGEFLGPLLGFPRRFLFHFYVFPLRTIFNSPYPYHPLFLLKAIMNSMFTYHLP